MPPKVKVSKEDILRVAMDIVRQDGANALNARTIATALHCSTQPLFSNFATMEELRFAVAEAGMQQYAAYTAKAMAKNEFPPYKASGMAYIRFAREERELFKLLFMCDRTTESVPEDTRGFHQMAALVQQTMGLSAESATVFHLEMWAFVHGVATMCATRYLDLDDALISRMLSDVYHGLVTRYRMEAPHGCDTH